MMMLVDCKRVAERWRYRLDTFRLDECWYACVSRPNDSHAKSITASGSSESMAARAAVERMLAERASQY